MNDRDAKFSKMLRIANPASLQDEGRGDRPRCEDDFASTSRTVSLPSD
jgi:hypothetical protein